MPKTLEYRLIYTSTPFSLSPYDSDLISNALVMDQIVGTLVKYGGQGRYEPYLAEKWHSENSGKTWTFTLKENLANEKNEPITAQRYVISLKRILSHLGSKSRNLPVFSLLEGWENFLTDPEHNNLPGLTAPNDREITFSFKEMPDGFLEYLAMPYYGFYSLSDFLDLSGNWISKQKITASGAYQVEEIVENTVTLKKRDGWFSHLADSPTMVRVLYSDFSEANKPLKHTIIEKGLQPEDKWNSNFKVVTTTPTTLVALVLSPYKGLFADPENRKLFYSRLEAAKRETPFMSPAARMANSFYFASPIKRDLPQSSLSSFRISGERKVSFLYYGSPETERNRYIRNLLLRIFDGENIEVEPVRNDDSKIDLMSPSEANQNFDIRLDSVDIGGNAKNWVVKMMFCSPLGVSFPDHSGKICELTSTYESGKISDESYPDLFNNILLEDVTALPLWHTSATWLFSNDIDLENISPSMNLPRFDQIRLK